ncbi:MAG: hypothetical protein QOH31_3319, partial [Verrucomicrobiota bacterium]
MIRGEMGGNPQISVLRRRSNEWPVLARVIYRVFSSLGPAQGAKHHENYQPLRVNETSVDDVARYQGCK